MLKWNSFFNVLCLYFIIVILEFFFFQIFIFKFYWYFPLVQFSHSVMSDSLRPNGLQHTRPPYPSPTLGVHSSHVHSVSDQPSTISVKSAIQPSHPLSSPSAPDLNLSQHQGLFKWVRSSHQVAKVLEFQLQHQSFQWTPRTDFL